MDGVMCRTAAMRHSGSLRLMWHCRRAAGNVASVPMLPVAVSMPMGGVDAVSSNVAVLKPSLFSFYPLLFIKSTSRQH